MFAWYALSCSKISVQKPSAVFFFVHPFQQDRWVSRNPATRVGNGVDYMGVFAQQVSVVPGANVNVITNEQNLQSILKFCYIKNTILLFFFCDFCFACMTHKKSNRCIYHRRVQLRTFTSRCQYQSAKRRSAKHQFTMHKCNSHNDNSTSIKDFGNVWIMCVCANGFRTVAILQHQLKKNRKKQKFNDKKKLKCWIVKIFNISKVLLNSKKNGVLQKTKTTENKALRWKHTTKKKRIIIHCKNVFCFIFFLKLFV